MGSKYPNGNGEDPFPPLLRNPLVPRPPLNEYIEPLDDSIFEGPIGKKIAAAIWALVTRTDQHTKDQEAFSTAVFAAFERGDGVARTLHDGIQEIKVVLHMSPPPMRPESPSGIDLLENSSKSFGERMKEMAASSAGGPGKVLATPAELEQVARGSFDEQMRVYLQKKRIEDLEAAETKRVADLAEKEALDKRMAEDAAKQRRNFWVLTFSGAIVVLFGVVGTYIATRAANERDKALAHEQGLAEGIKSAPVSTVVVAAAPADIVIPPASVSAPAFVAPRRAH